MKNERIWQSYVPSVFAVALLIVSVLLTMAVQGGPPAQQHVGLESSTTASSQASSVEGSQAGASSTAAPVNTAPKDEMRAVWVPYMSLAMSSQADQSQAAFQKKFDAIVANAKSKGMNTLIVHVRPFGDALYPSDYFPWSHILTGMQGVNPGYDPLAYMVQATHKSGMKIHAWVNPLRIRTNNTPTVLAQSNPYNKWDLQKLSGRTVTLDNGSYYNPAYPEVLKLVTDGVGEIVKKYDVDGIQFDDYFYPTESSVFDTGSYGAYLAEAKKNGSAMELLEWRRANINKMVSMVYREIKSIKPNVLFGISPQGNVQNDLRMGADVVSWASTAGYVDYICPQLYVNFENPILPFDQGAKQWKQMVTAKGVQLYFGLAVYKAGTDVDEGTWKKSSDILQKQIELGRQIGSGGFMFYAYDQLDAEHSREEVKNVIKLLN